MDINHLYHTNNINGLYQTNLLFKDFDDEIYTIKDLNQKKISDIIREIQNKKDVEKPHLSQDKKEHIQKLSESMKKINELYYNIFDVKSLKQKYENQKEKKYQEFKKFINRKNKKDILQRKIDNLLKENLKEKKEKKKEHEEKIKKKKEEEKKEEEKNEEKKEEKKEEYT